MFEKQLVVLNPKFNVVGDKNLFLITNNEDHVALTNEFRLNFIALCGRNGVGKSTFLRMLAGRYSFESDYTVCWIDSAGEVACTESINLRLQKQDVSLKSRVHDYSLSSLCGNQNLGEPGEENHVRRNLLQVYSVNPDLFNLHGVPVFDGFHLDRPARVLDVHELERDLTEHLGMDLKASFGQFQKILELHPTFHVLASIAEDFTFKNLCGKLIRRKKLTYNVLYRALRDEESESLDKEINGLIYADGNRGGILENGAGGVLSMADPNWIKYTIEEYDEIQRKLSEASGRVDEWIKLRLANLKTALWKDEHLNLHIWESRLIQLISFQPYKEFGGRISHLWNLSDGEYSQIKLLFDLGPLIMREDACWFYMDDVDDYLHPEWKRNLVMRIASTHVEFANRIAKFSKNKRYAEKTLLCVIATHSPFVLSDLPRHSVLQFVKGENGKTLIIRSAKNTFAGNIGELFHTEFFMDSTIGEFARQKIKTALKKLEGTPSPEELTEILKLFSLVGDDVLKNLLLEKFYHAKNRA